MSFLVDSGASATVIADVDAVRLGLDYDELQRLEGGMTGVGGTAETLVLKQADDVVLITDKEEQPLAMR